MIKPKKQELTIFLIIVGIASFFRLYQLDILPPDFQNYLLSLRLFSAILGIMTVVGIYLLTKELFEWRIASIAAYLASISFWHVNFSRTESVATIVPFMLVYSFYFIWKGLKRGRIINFIVAGIFGGLGFYTYPSFYVAPIIVLALFINYWWYLKKDFDHTKYEFAKTKLLQGFVALFFASLIIVLPLFIYSQQHQTDFLPPIKISSSSVIKTFGMFNFSGDLNQRHNIPGSPILPWPIGVFFAIGFINELIHWLRRKHGHFSTTHTLLLVWFFVMLIPGFLFTGAPNSLAIIGAMPVVMILTARGIWWFFDKLNSWYKAHDPHSRHEAHVVTALVVIVFLFSIGFMEYYRYFKVWGPSPETIKIFKQDISK